MIHRCVHIPYSVYIVPRQAAFPKSCLTRQLKFVLFELCPGENPESGIKYATYQSPSLSLLYREIDWLSLAALIGICQENFRPMPTDHPYFYEQQLVHIHNIIFQPHFTIQKIV